GPRRRAFPDTLAPLGSEGRLKSDRSDLLTTHLPLGLLLSPVSRWPTRLPEPTVQTALALSPISVDGVKVALGKRASVIIVTCGGLHYTKMCLTSVLSNGWNPGDELIVVDNGSEDGTPAYLRQLSALNPFIHVIFNESNRGFAVANNQGLAQA